MSDGLAGGRYSIVRRIAQGGMGEVLLADFPGDPSLGLTAGLVVVKRVLADHPNHEHQSDMLREEGRVALRLLHDNLVETFFVDEHEGDPLLVMEYLSGRAMSHVLGQAKKRKELVPVDHALALLRGAACGLHFAHTLSDRGRPLGLIHRDVSPANLFLTFDGRVKVIDFGVAKADDSEIRTSTGILKGKLGYMSPEHALGEKLTAAADLWSLGVLFWETLCAERLFSYPAPSATLQAITEKPVPLPTKHRPDVPAHVVELAMRLLERRVDRRIGSGAALVEAIDALPEAERLPRIDLGGWLSGRFPEEAEQGQREAARAARMRRRVPVPIGLVEGTAAPSASDDAPTLILASQRSIEARDLLAEEDQATVRLRPGASDDGRLAPGDDLASPPTTTPDADSDADADVDVNLATATLPELTPPKQNAPARPRSTTTPVAPGSSWVAVASLTFGALALAMGVAFSFAAPRPVVDAVLAYDDADSEVVVAPIDAPPVSRAVSLSAPEVRVHGEMKKLDPATFTRELADAGVLARASVPRTPRGMLAALLPVLIAGLGLLALAAALPAVVVPSLRLRLVAQLALVFACALVVAAVVKNGALSWPGLHVARTPAKLELAKATPATPGSASSDR